MTETVQGVVVTGELDLVSAPALRRALRACAEKSRRVEVDLGDVTFADVAAARSFYEVARELGDDATLVLRRTPTAVRRVLALVAWNDQRVEVEWG